MRRTYASFTAGRLAALVLALTATIGTVWAQDPSQMFRRLDRNNDGKLTRDELPEAMRGNFDKVDADKSGSISAVEFSASGRLLMPLRIPEAVKLVADIPYAGTDNPRQQLDLLVPRTPKSDKPLPVIVFFHGGAWQQGDRSGGLPTLVRYVEGGEYAGITVGYRLTGEAKWPAQIHDCKAAIRWILS